MSRGPLNFVATVRGVASAQTFSAGSVGVIVLEVPDAAPELQTGAIYRVRLQRATRRTVRANTRGRPPGS